jgi:hypothetical protein
MPKICSLGGFVYEGPDRIFLNHRPTETGDPSRRQFEALGLGERDILLLTTRPPLNDHGIRPLRSSGSEVESIIFDALKKSCFHHCSRGNIHLRHELARGLSAGFRGRSEIEFSQYIDPESLSTGTYRALHGEKEAVSVPWNEMMTAGYLLNVPLGAGLPSLLAIFSLSGTTSLAFAHLLLKNADVLREALQSPSFTMAEIQSKPILGHPVDFSFCDSWDMRVIGRY